MIRVTARIEDPASLLDVQQVVRKVDRVLWRNVMFYSGS